MLYGRPAHTHGTPLVSLKWFEDMREKSGAIWATHAPECPRTGKSPYFFRFIQASRLRQLGPWTASTRSPPVKLTSAKVTI